MDCIFWTKSEGERTEAWKKLTTKGARVSEQIYSLHKLQLSND